MSPSRPIVRDLDVPAHSLRWLAARFPSRYPVLLDSAAEGALAAHTILVGRPSASLWLDAQGMLGGEGLPAGVLAGSGGFLAALERWWSVERGEYEPSSLPFAGGWTVFLSYEMAAEIEPRLRLPPASLTWRAFALRTPCALVHELKSDRVRLVGEHGAGESLEEMANDAREVVAQGPHRGAANPIEALREEEPSAYLDRVVRAQAYIRAGDIYQANLCRRWDVDLARPVEAAAVYDRLRRANPAPFAALAQWRGLTIMSSSPERLVRVAARRVETRPIAGTRPRSGRPGQDQPEIRELAAHPKERAEHIMLIDLERNDLGRICEPGSVRVDELMTIESYAHVHHIVSNVSGMLRPDVTPVGVLRAVFPGGTITGCPKFRCMQIIAELEGAGRGAYTGSVGFLGRDGNLDMNILIRTMTAQDRRIELRAGGGIVADSDPLRELEETRAKARGLLAVFE